MNMNNFSLGTYNGMLRHSFGRAVIFVSLQHFIAPALDFRPNAMASCHDTW